MSHATRLSYYVEEYSPNYKPQEINRKALSWLIKNSKDRGFVAVNIPRSLDAVLENVLPDIDIRGLKSRGKTTIESVELVRLTTNKTVPDAGTCPIVAFHPTNRLLNRLDSILNVSALLVVPITLKEIDGWIKKWVAKELKL